MPPTAGLGPLLHLTLGQVGRQQQGPPLGSDVGQQVPRHAIHPCELCFAGRLRAGEKFGLPMGEYVAPAETSKVNHQD